MLFGDDNNALMFLVAINAILYIAIVFAWMFFKITEPNDANLLDVSEWFTLSGNMSLFVLRPWTILSYMFTQTGFFFLLINMVWLWTFGSILQSMVGNTKLIPLYIYGGLAGGVVYVVASLIMSSSINSYSLEGANAAIMCVAVATTVLVPDYRFFRMLNGGIPIWVLTLVYVIIDMTGASPKGTAYSLSHLGGAGAGYLFVVLLRRGVDGSLWMNNFYQWISNLFNPAKRNKLKVVKDKVFYKTGTQKPYTKKARITENRVDEILDKINQKGYQSLSEEEKDILKRAGES